MAIGSSFSRHALARLLDFFDESTHWQRRLWNAGLVLSLREVLEACEATRDRALGGPSLAWLVESTRKKIAEDPGTGSPEQRATLANALKGTPEADGVAYRVISIALEDIQRHYLGRWREVLATSESPPGRERASRAIGAHLLDAGLPAPHLREWLTGLLQKNDDLAVTDMIDEAEMLLQQPPTNHQVLVLFATEPVSRATKPPEWVDSKRAAQWLRANAVEFRPRQRGGFLFDVEAHGAEAAVARASELADQITARVSVGTRSEAVFHPRAAVAGKGVLPLRRSRRVEVRALERENRVFQLAAGDVVDAALELLSHLDSGPRAPAVAGGWSAIEILMRAPGDTENVLAADRLAVLAACSWPRAELTDLAWSWARQGGDQLATDLQAQPTNREKAARMAEAIAAKTRLDFKSHSDVAAVHRMETVLGSPRRLLLDVRDHVTESFRRLYRQRNLVMHGGRTSAVALDASLRTAAPLVGAGVDRIAHGYFTQGRHPLELLARATFEIERAGTDGAPTVTDLLE
jgi:hypothetical protein